MEEKDGGAIWDWKSHRDWEATSRGSDSGYERFPLCRESIGGDTWTSSRL